MAVINSENQLIRGASWQHDSSNKEDYADHFVFRKGISTLPKHYDGKILSLLTGGGGNYNYYHWLFDVIPRYFIAEQLHLVDRETLFYLPALQYNFQRETLDWLHIPVERTLLSTNLKHVRASCVIATDHPNPNSAVPGWICDSLRKTFCIGVSPPREEGVKLYISRLDSKNGRRIINENGLAAELSAAGFEIVRLSELSFTSQVSLFMSAKQIIAPHGAGLANLVFCKQGTKVIEIFNTEYKPLMYRDISLRVGLDYVAFDGAATQSIFQCEEDRQISDITVDISSVMQSL